MCNRYKPTPREKISPYYQLDLPLDYPMGEVFPRGRGAFIRRTAAAGGREMVVGQWGLVPFFAKSSQLAYATNNARAESVAEKATFKLPWVRGQRCIISAERFWEPCWETGRNQWWNFCRADGAPLSLAGLWSTWTNRETGELLESYTLLTVNADAHTIMRRMHKPDPRLPADQQDKRSVVVLEHADLDQWLHGTVADAQALLRTPADDVFEAQPEG